MIIMVVVMMMIKNIKQIRTLTPLPLYRNLWNNFDVIMRMDRINEFRPKPNGVIHILISNQKPTTHSHTLNNLYIHRWPRKTTAMNKNDSSFFLNVILVNMDEKLISLYSYYIQHFVIIIRFDREYSSPEKVNIWNIISSSKEKKWKKKNLANDEMMAPFSIVEQTHKHTQVSWRRNHLYLSIYIYIKHNCIQ